jgi:S-sulfosulfanyl-L-cysteine sulfohydrolase
MAVTRRDFLRILTTAAGLAATGPRALAKALEPERLLDFASLGNVTLLHLTDSHASLLPVYYREPDVNLNAGEARGRPPYVTGQGLLDAYGIARGSAEAYALTHLDFPEMAARYGAMGGYAHLATLVERVRAERPGQTLLLDSGDAIQGSATALWSRGEDMVLAANRLGVDACTGHWEFTYGLDRMRELFGDREKHGLFGGEFLAHNVSDISWGPPGDPVYRPYTIREAGGVAIGIIGQAFPYVAVSHPQRFVPHLTFGIREEKVQRLVDELRDRRKVDCVVLLSHNGLYVDLKLATRVRGLDVVLAGHTHDAVPRVLEAEKTLIVSSGAHGKFLSRLDVEVQNRRIAGYRYRLIPVLARTLPEDPGMAALIRQIRAPHAQRLAETLAVAEDLLYRRSNFTGTFDEVILEALLKHYDAQVAFSAGFRWGTTILPGDPIRVEDLYAHTAVTYPQTWVREMTGEEIKTVLEDVADNLFHPDPYYRQGGDMVRVGGLSYAIDPGKTIGARISEIRVNGAPLEPAKRYKAAGWASLREADGPPVYDVVADYLRRVKRVRVDSRPRVRVI